MIGPVATTAGGSHEHEHPGPRTVYVVRHAHAGSRAAWAGADDDRPLTRRGRREAAALAAQLVDGGIGRLVSSPAARCIQTLEPLADGLGLHIDADPRLLEGAGGGDILGLAAELRDGHRAAVICSHGDVIPELLRLLKAGRTRFTDPFVWPKASTWVLTCVGDRWTRARYLAPPQVG